jgi:DNA transposition AAA+ family ATPase
MSSTRHAEDEAPLSQERYMSSPEYRELRGISGNAVAAKAALLGHPAKRSLLFFLQALSLQPGGLQKFTREFLAMFADRIGTPTMHRVGMKPGQKYDWQTARAVENELCEGSDELLAARLDKLDGPKARPINDEPRSKKSRPVEELLDKCHGQLAKLPGFIIELCINPRLRFAVPGETEAAMERERITLEEQFEGTGIYRTWAESYYNSTSLGWFKDVIGALFEYKRRYEAEGRKNFVTTEVAALVFETLDVCLATGKMVVIQGESRIGKTTAAEAWCQQHLGEARFVSLNGIRNYTGVFRAIAKALGLASSYAHTTTKVQARIEDMLQRSRLVLVLDEAHFLLSAAERTRTAPELIDWVNTALCNHHVPCALVCTPQLTLRMARHEHQAGWNADQWRGRVKRFCQLPAVPKAQDLRAVARKVLPGVDKDTIDYVVGYALSSKLHMPAVVDVADEARLLVQREDRTEITFEDVERGIRDYCAPSVAAMIQTFRAANDGKGRCKPARSAPVAAPESGQEPVETRGRDISPRLLPVASGGSRMRFRESAGVTSGTPDEAILAPV